MTLSVMRIAAVQMVSGPDVGPNLDAAARLVARAAAEGAQFVALPEYFPLIGADDADRVAAREEENGGPIQRFLADLARAYGVWLVGGSIPLRGNDAAKLRNAALVFDPAGSRIARYDKMHLFGFTLDAESYDESLTIEAGDMPGAFEAPFGRVGLAICYDLRFPELFRALGEMSLVVVPAAFTETTGRAHWELLLRARAVENQCYVLASAQGGEHPNGRLTHGNSMIVDPWGQVIGRLDKGEGVVVAELAPSRIAEVRAALPALKHRKI